MSKPQLPVPAGFPKLLKEIKARIQQAQTRAMVAANAELVRLYWDIGRLIDQRQRQGGWGAAVIPRLARELRNELPVVKGFSERNIGRMIAFYREYTNPPDFLPQAAAKLPSPENLPQVAAKFATFSEALRPATPSPDSLLWSIPWFHHIVLMEKVKDRAARFWYMQETLANGWSRSVLLLMVRSEAHRRQGQALTNFDRLLPSPQSDLAQQLLKDPYIFDFLTIEEPFHERELETNLLHQLERFLLELGQGFAFVSRQYCLKVGEQEFFIDLLFYHLKLRCFVVIDLKKGGVQTRIRREDELLPERCRRPAPPRVRCALDRPDLCQDRNHIIAEYALRGVSKPIGISEYELTRALPPSLKSALPTVEEIEAELTESATVQSRLPKSGKKATKTKNPAPKKQQKKGRRR